MDFHTLSRKQLQALCKKNKIPANMTNVAMANALAALQQVEGMDEILNPVDPDAQKFPDEMGVATPDVHRTACRTSTRRKQVTEEPESSKISTRLQRRTRAGNDEGTDQENKDLNVPVTPAVPTSRRRAPAVSTRRKKDDEKPTDPVPKTPAASSSRVRATSAYSTRRSVRLLEKNLSKMSLMDTEETGSMNVDEISEEMTSFSEQIEDSEDTEKGATSLMISAEASEKTDELELTSSGKNLPKVNLMDTVESGLVKVDEISEERTGIPQQIEESEDIEKGASPQKISTEAFEKSNELELNSKEKNSEFECQSNGSSSEVHLVSAVASVTGACLQAEPQECLMKTNDFVSPLKNMKDGYESDVELTKSIGKEGDDANNELGSGDSCQIENSSDSSKPESNISPRSKNDAFPDDKQKKNEHSNIDIQISELMLCSQNENKTVVKMDEDSVSKGGDEDDASMVVAENKTKANEHSNVGSNDVHSSEQILRSEEMFCAENKAVETETSPDFEEPKEYVAKDANMEIFSEPSIEENSNVQSVAVSHSPLVESEAESDSETIEATVIQIDNEEWEENAAAAESESETIETTVIQIDNEEWEQNSSETIRTSDIQLDNEESEENTAAAEAEFETIQTPDIQIEDEGSEKNVAAPEAEYETIETRDIQIDNEECKENTAAAEAESETMETTDIQLNSEESKENAAADEAESETIETEAEAEETLDATSRTCASIISEQNTTDVPVQVPCQDQSELKKDNVVAVEDQTLRKMCNQEEDKQKENLNIDDLKNKSLRKLRKMFKDLSLDGKTDNNSNSVKEQEVERKRTALQVLPENQMPASKGRQL